MVRGQELAGGRGRIGELSPSLRFKRGDHSPDGGSATGQTEPLGPQAQSVKLGDGPVSGQPTFGDCQQPHGQQAHEPSQIRVRRLDLDILFRIPLMLDGLFAYRQSVVTGGARAALQGQVQRAVLGMQGDRLDAEPIRPQSAASRAPAAWPRRRAQARFQRPVWFASCTAALAARAVSQDPRGRGANS